jgi:hypothetical protein
MKAFVGSRVMTKEELLDLVKNATIAPNPTYYFLRWPHRVSGIQMTLPEDFPSPEGQLFNTKLELRWKQRGIGYEILFLGKEQPDTKFKFSQLEGEWEYCDRTAFFYESDETKFPQGFLYQNEEGQMIAPKTIPIKQRYFKNTQTARIHFVALTVKQS